MNEPLPIVEALPALRAALQADPMVLLQAPPGAGKSTVLPLELLREPWLLGQRVLMLEPRRLAARSVAARMASTLGEPVGETVGYRVRFEQRVGPRTRIEVVTEGILTRRMQADPALEGVGLVIFDEFHERGLQADLALALCRQAQSVLRQDLRLLVMSATLDSAALRPALGNPPVITATGRQYPVDLRYAEREPGGPLPAAVADAVWAAWPGHIGDILAFLPGVGEIARAAELLAERLPEAALHPLFGDLSLEAQQAAIEPDPRGRRKVVLATALAETSLTIEGVRVVVDSGFSRVPAFDSRTGLTRLETARVTLDSADQRAGRAGRLGPGVCYRLWTAAAHSRLNPTRKPEILAADLTPLRLELAQWGARDAGELQWVTPPPPGALQQAFDLLQELGAMAGTQLTERGRAMLEWPTHPRFAHMLMEAGRTGPLSHAGSAHRAGALPALAADLAALLDERDPLPRGAGADISLRIEALRGWRQTKRAPHSADARGLARIERIAQQWRKQLGVREDNAAPDPYDLGWLVAQAYPDRIAQARASQSAHYRLSGGRGVQLGEGDPLIHSRWLAVAQVDGGSGSEGKVYLAAPLGEDELESLAVERDVLEWDSRQGLLLAKRERRVGELVLSSKPASQTPRDQRVRVLCAAVRTEGLGILKWTEACQQWRARVQTVRQWRGGEWPDLSDQALLDQLEVWLGPGLEAVSKRDDFARLDVQPLLAALTPRALLARLESIAPTHINVPSGSSIRLDYNGGGSGPVLAVKLQEMFGLADTPTVNEGRTKVTLHLLSPAQRPIQVTQDLHSFWTNTYPTIRKELRGRYNKHPWPEDPWTAPPTKRTVRTQRPT